MMSSASKQRDRSRTRLRTGGAALALDLQRDAGAPARARAAVTDWSQRQEVAPTQLQMLVLLVSEVVSNAVLHSKAPNDAAISLRATLEGEAIRVSVSDAGEGFTPKRRDPGRITDGYGLFLLDKIASRWGVDAKGATSVWFELPLREDQ
jgi:anti-sigma regulatory factor (Ser/Thr protein kinase)